MIRAALVILLFLLPVPAWAQAVTASVDRMEITLDESLDLTVVVEGLGNAQVDVSAIKDFKINSSRKSTNVSIVNNRMTQALVYNYLLLPVRAGLLTIPSLTVTVKGQTHQTDEIKIQVTEARSAGKGDRDVFMEAEVSKSTCYEGESLGYKVSIYAAVRVADAKFQKPDFSGFTVDDLPGTRNFKINKGGRQYTVTEVSFLLTPIKPGGKTIGPAILQLDILRPGKNTPGYPRARSLWSMDEIETKIFQTKPLTVDVKAVPPFKGPGRFSGLVGRFNLGSELEKPVVAVGESTTVAITVEGVGNIKDAGEIDFEYPPAFKLYKDAPQEEISITEKGYAGKKVFRFALVALAEGDFQIPAIGLTYFDPAEKKYVTVKASPLSIKVNPGSTTEPAAKTAESLPPPGQPEPAKQKVRLLNRDILPVKSDPGRLHDQTPIRASFFILFMILPGLGYGSVVLINRFLSKKTDAAKQMTQKARRAVKQAGGASNRSEGLGLCGKALIWAINSRAGREGESLTYKEAERILGANRVKPETAEQALNLLRKIDSARYGPGPEGRDSLESILSETQKVVKALCR